MTSIFLDFHDAYAGGSGQLLAACLALVNISQDTTRLRSFANLTNHATVSADIGYHLFRNFPASYNPPKNEADAWIDIFVILWKTAKEIVAIEDGLPLASWEKVFNNYKELVNNLMRGYTNSGLEAWSVPCLPATAKALMGFAAKADAEARSKNENSFGDGLADDIVNTGGNEKLESVAWILNRMFSICVNDRSEITQSRKWGVYSVCNLMFKLYFRLNSINLCKNVMHSLDTSRNQLPALVRFPKSQVVTFRYYLGVIAFLEESYSQAEEHLTEAYNMCHRDAQKNRELILTYLIPCHVLTTHTLPTKTLLAPYPRLEALFRPICRCIQRGDLSGFDAALAQGEHEFVRRRIYLTLERGRDIALRNLFRLVFLAGGYEEAKEGEQAIRRTRIGILEFETAIRLGSKSEKTVRIDTEEVECFAANLIYKNLMKGYISRAHACIVLNKKGAFPGTGV